ncbi:hypothetical protein HMPREF9120_02919 [Neisseria sp. oral taxon 020 str. F0370]|nr:hypothetical protein HMPREF9120_02919 [Neisseria sp. oral taxon 020 str. F0370]
MLTTENNKNRHSADAEFHAATLRTCLVFRRPQTGCGRRKHMTRRRRLVKMPRWILYVL